MNNKFVDKVDINRRSFLKAGSATSMAFMSGVIPSVFNIPISTVLPNQLLYDTIYDTDRVKSIAMAAVEAAVAEGAAYADARLTRIVYQDIAEMYDTETLAVGVRAVYNGAWGFASGPYWDAEDAVKMARSATQQAKYNSRIASREIDLGVYPIINGTWSTPLEIDPFKISMEEKLDYIESIEAFVPRRVKDRIYLPRMTIKATRSEVSTATSDGSYFTQTFHDITMDFRMKVDLYEGDKKVKDAFIYSKSNGTYGAGWDYILNANIREQVPFLMDEADERLALSKREVDIGKYDIVCDARTTARLVRGTFGDATQIDRVLGYEANSGGTSYLGPDPMEYLGAQVGDSLINLRGDRTMPLGLATAGWDEEGVTTSSFDLINQGRLVDYQTTRESAAWLSEWYNKQGKPTKSNGCSRVTSAINMPLQFAPNLVMLSGGENITFEGMISSVSKGLALFDCATTMDYQSSSGLVTAGPRGYWREIVDGKLGDLIADAGLLFTSAEIWKNVEQIGGEDSLEGVASLESKGEPTHHCLYTVSAVPCQIKEASIINRRARA